jgi:hypothetical protein
MLNVENLFEPIAIKAMINRIYNYSLWERLYTFSNKNILSVKHAMKSYIRVEKNNLTKQGHLRLYTQEESPPRQ